MVRRTVQTVFLLAMVLLMGAGCASKQEYNKPAEHWYENILQSIQNRNLDSADDYYLSLQSEHPRSPLLEGATLIMAKAHEDSRDNLLSEFYYDEYIRRFATNENMAYYQFKKVEASFKQLRATNKQQKLIRETIAKADTFINRYPDSEYVPLVQTLRTRLHMSEYMINENIAGLYDRVGKEDAAKIYRQRNKESWLADSDIEFPKRNIIRRIFE